MSSKFAFNKMAVFKSKFPDVFIPEMALDEFIMEHFDRYGDSVALVL